MPSRSHPLRRAHRHCFDLDSRSCTLTRIRRERRVSDAFIAIPELSRNGG